MLKLFLSLLVICLLSGCAATEKTSNKPLLTYGIIYGITLDAEFNVTSIRLARVQDPYKKQQVEFVPSPEYIANAERQLKARDYAGAQTGIEFFVICGYADVRPNTALCGGEL